VKTADEFWAKVDQRAETECWPYTGAKKRAIPRGPRDEYGMVMWRGHIAHAHRVALLLSKGEPPAGKPHALHRCDNPPCCNPEHLEWGSAQDNMDQMAARGRRRAPHHRSEDVGTAKLTPAAAREIRAAFPSVSARTLAVKFGVQEPAIYRVLRRETWKQA
jgi:hypothetical protein